VKKNNQYKENINLFDVPENLKNAKIKDIYTDDKARADVIKWILNYIKDLIKEELNVKKLSSEFENILEGLKY